MMRPRLIRARKVCKQMLLQSRVHVRGGRHLFSFSCLSWHEKSFEDVSHHVCLLL
jgi:hypothetical protein